MTVPLIASPCHHRCDGKTSGVPSTALEMSTSPTRYRVWLHELRNPPSRDGSDKLSPPLLNRSATTSACVVSSQANTLLTGSSARTPLVVTVCAVAIELHIDSAT